MSNVIVQVEKTRTGFVVTDGSCRRHKVQTEAEIGRKIVELMSDPSLPAPQVDERNDVVGFFASLVRRALPKQRELVDAVEPVAHQATAMGRRLRHRAGGSE